jgi:hypothetical protein
MNCLYSFVFFLQTSFDVVSMFVFSGTYVIAVCLCLAAKKHFGTFPRVVDTVFAHPHGNDGKSAYTLSPQSAYIA